MKPVLLSILLTLIAVSFPWRLTLLGIQMLMLRPGLTRVVEDDSRYWDARAMESRLRGLGYSVSYTKHLNVMGVEIYGLTNTEEHTVQVDADLHWSQRFYILAHEGGHILQPYWVGRGEEECFAESVATLVSRNGIREHARYLSSHKLECAAFMLFEWPAIYHAAAVLEDR